MSVDTAMAGAFDSMGAFMKGLETSLGKSLKPLEEVSKEMGKSSFGKNAKALGGAMKSMAGASVQAWAMEQLMKLIEPFLNLLKLFEIPINVLAALLTMFVNEIFKDLLPYFIEFSLLLLKLTPYFQIAGQWVSWFITTVITGLVIAFQWIGELIKKIAVYLNENFIPAWEKVKAFFVRIGQFIKDDFLALWDGLKRAWEWLKTAYDNTLGKLFGEDGYIAVGFRALMNIAKNIVNGVIGVINNILSKINDILGTSIKTIPYLAKGGIATEPTLAMIGEKGAEAVVPLTGPNADKYGMGGNNKEMIFALEENTAEARKTRMLFQDFLNRMM